MKPVGIKENKIIVTDYNEVADVVKCNLMVSSKLMKSFYGKHFKIITR